MNRSRQLEIFGVDIGGTKCAISRWRGSGPVREIHRFRTEGPEDTLDEVARVVTSHRSSSPGAIGIACGGPLDTDRGLILSPPNLPGWDRISVTRILSRACGLPAFLMNDANANALAEWRFGGGRGSCVLVFLTAGTGMGAGIVVNGHLLGGANGNAGEIGHIRLTDKGPIGFRKAGSCEGFCSGGGIARLASFLPRSNQPDNLERWMRDHPEASAIAHAARRGDRTARAVYTESGHRLGQMLAIMIDVLNPDRIVLGSLWLRCRDLLEPAMRRSLHLEALPQSLRVCKIVPAKLGESLGNYGAVCAALEGLGCLASPRAPRGRSRTRRSVHRC